MIDSDADWPALFPDVLRELEHAGALPAAAVRTAV
jgi:hypothetical protein